jgi:hypothetical protein
VKRKPAKTKPPAIEASSVKTPRARVARPRKTSRVRSGALATARALASVSSARSSALWISGVLGAALTVTAVLWTGQQSLEPPAPNAVQGQPGPATAMAPAPAQPPAPARAETMQVTQAAPAAPIAQVTSIAQSTPNNTPDPQPARAPAAVQQPAPAAPPTAPAAKPDTPTPAPHAAPGQQSQASDPLSRGFAAARGLSVPDRVSYWTDFFHGSNEAKSLLSSLGDGPRIEDSQPLLAGKFDCTTFVETVAALARSNEASQFYPNLIAIRYRGGHATYGDRNHFPEADWIPNNERAGILRDVTSTVAQGAGFQAQTISKRIDRASWFAEQVRQGKAGRSPASDSRWTPVDAKVLYIPVADLDRALEGIPSGAIVNFVHQSNRYVLITHQGFVIRRGNEVFLRHASIGGHIRVVPLSKYVHEEAGSHVVGINLNQLNG